MTAIAVRDTQPSRRLGMKILAATLTIVCIVPLLIQPSRRCSTVEAARALAGCQSGVPAGPGRRAGDLARADIWSEEIHAG